MVTTRPPKTIVKPTALGPVANTDTNLLIYGLFQKGRVLAQDGVPSVQFSSATNVQFTAAAALLHGPEQIADLPVPVVESPGAVRIGHPERGHLVEYLAPNSVFNSLPRQRSCPHLGPDDRFVTIDRVLHHASLGAA